MSRPLTLTNPATMLSFIAIFGGLAAGGVSVSPPWMTACVQARSALWCLLLCAVVGAFAAALTPGSSARWDVFQP